MTVDPISVRLYVLYQAACELMLSKDGPPAYRLMSPSQIKQSDAQIRDMQAQLSRLVLGSNKVLDPNNGAVLQMAQAIGDPALAICAWRRVIERLEAAKFDLIRTSPRDPFDHLVNCRVVWARVCRSKAQADHPGRLQVVQKLEDAQADLQRFNAMPRAKKARFMTSVERAKVQLAALDRAIEVAWHSPTIPETADRLLQGLYFFRDVMPSPYSPLFEKPRNMPLRSLHALLVLIGGSLLVSQMLAKDTCDSAQ